MERNQVIALVLISAILLVYFQFFGPEPPEKGQQPTAQPSDTTQAPSQQKQQAEAEKDQNQQASQAELDSGFAQDFQPQTTTLRTEDLELVFSNRGGQLREVRLRNYQQAIGEQPVTLLNGENARFSQSIPVNGRVVDIFELPYKASVTGQKTLKAGDSLALTYRSRLKNGAEIAQTYTIRGSGYQIGYRQQITGLSADSAVRLHWQQRIINQEPHPEEARNKARVNYLTTDRSLESTSETDHERDEEVFEEAVKWMSFKQKYFLSSLIAAKSFPQGRVANTVENPEDSTYLKTMEAHLALPASQLRQGAEMKFYFGPNKYDILRGIAMEFEKNVYLGWTVFGVINRIATIPIFHFLEDHIGSYGIIVIILVLILRVVLFPLSYKSYMGMAKMRVIKPELDELKAQYGEDEQQKVQQEQFRLMQQAGINPLAGCIPLLLQMPLLLAMFNFFPNSIELRQESFLWAQDLSTYDSLFLIPDSIPFLDGHISLFTILMTLSTLGLTVFTNQFSSGQMQQGPYKYMTYIMPFAFFFILNSFPAGLNLYYLTSNLLSITQQISMRQFVNEDKIHAKLQAKMQESKEKPKKKNRFMQRLEDAQKKAQEQQEERQNRNQKRAKRK